VLDDLAADLVEVLPGVRVLHVGWPDVELVVRGEVLVVVVVRHLGIELAAAQDTGLEGPGPGHIAHRVPATTNNHHGQVEALHKVHAVRVPFHTEVEAPQAVAGETVAAALQDYGLGAEPLHDVPDDGLEDAAV
ncbi:hypothetical protein KEM55_007634, partial [Ascosphaera atra]